MSGLTQDEIVDLTGYPRDPRAADRTDAGLSEST
jgi:hypothetical protein